MLRIFLISFALLFSSASFANYAYRQATVIIINTTNKPVTVQQFDVTSGQWQTSQAPEEGEIILPFAKMVVSTTSREIGIGTSGYLGLSQGIFSWQLPWNGQAASQFHSMNGGKADVQAVPHSATSVAFLVRIVN